MTTDKEVRARALQLLSKRRPAAPRPPERHGTCPFGGSWDDCPHTWDDVNRLIREYDMRRVMASP